MLQLWSTEHLKPKCAAPGGVAAGSGAVVPKGAWGGKGQGKDGKGKEKAGAPNPNTEAPKVNKTIIEEAAGGPAGGSGGGGTGGDTGSSGGVRVKMLLRALNS